MTLDIITPEMIYFSGEVSMVTVPGKRGSFTMLENHAPIISALTKGKIMLRTNDSEKEINITGGFIEGHENKVIISVETII